MGGLVAMTFRFAAILARSRTFVRDFWFILYKSETRVQGILFSKLRKSKIGNKNGKYSEGLS